MTALTRDDAQCPRCGSQHTSNICEACGGRFTPTAPTRDDGLRCNCAQYGHAYDCPIHTQADYEAQAVPTRDDGLRWWAECVKRLMTAAPIHAVASETGTTDRAESLRIVDEWVAEDEAVRAATAADATRPEDGASLIAAERHRQITEEGYTAKHDAEHEGALAMAGAAYALLYAGERDAADYWPWDESAWKPKNSIRDLVRAGALIAAEIDRALHTASEPPHDFGQQGWTQGLPEELKP